MISSDDKSAVIQTFSRHVSSGKAAFFKKYGMDFVMGNRDGNWLVDKDGNKRLFNLHCNGGVFNLGHRNPQIIATLKAALEELDIGNHHLMSEERARLARQLSDLMPGDLSCTVFGVSGGEAVDLALKVARSHTRRTRIISARGGYHGHTGLALAAGDEKYRRPFGPMAPGFLQVPFGDAEALNDALDDNTAAVILETIPATLGMVIPTKEYMQEVRRLCDHWGALLILDEVQSGLGRTGKLWAFEHYDIIPDIVVLGKGLSGGLYPITATVLRQPLEQVFHDDPFIHISTFGGAEIGCRVARKVLDITADPDFLSEVNDMADRTGKHLELLITKHRPFFSGVRQLGLMMGLELQDEIAGPVLTKAAYDKDLLMVYANNDQSVCQFLPPLTMKKEDLPFIIDRLENALTQARRLRKLYQAKTMVTSLFRKKKNT
ncbi:MAG: aspartate aminotransferase family protein [Fidelibacterota bacterium]